MRSAAHRRAWWGLLACAAGLLACAGLLCTLDHLIEGFAGLITVWTAWFALLAGAWWCVRRVDVPRALLAIVVTSVLLRVLMLFVPATLSTDWYRYLWDGQLTVHGEDPYAAVPTDESLSAFRDDVLLPTMNSPDYFTVYPPVSQAAFAAAWWLGGGDAVHALLWLKAIFATAEMLGVLAIIGWLGALGVDRRRVVLYAWNPIAVVELVGSVHSEALLIAPLAGCLWAVAKQRDALAGALLAVAVWVKLFPVVAAAALARHVGLRRSAVAAVTCFGFGLTIGWIMLRPTAVANVRESLGLYAGVFSFNHGLFDALWWVWHRMTGGDLYDAYRAVSRWLLVLYAGGAAALVLFVRPKSGRALALVLLALFGGYVVANATLHPWYLAWVLWLLPATAGVARPWLWLSYAAGWSYLGYHQDPVAVPVWVLVIEWGGFGLLLAADGLRLLRRRRTELHVEVAG